MFSIVDSLTHLNTDKNMNWRELITGHFVALMSCAMSSTRRIPKGTVYSFWMGIVSRIEKGDDQMVTDREHMPLKSRSVVQSRCAASDTLFVGSGSVVPARCRKNAVRFQHRFRVLSDTSTQPGGDRRRSWNRSRRSPPPPAEKGSWCRELRWLLQSQV